MATIDTPNLAAVLPLEWTFADVQRHLGDIPAERILAHPAPGTATEQDVIRLRDRQRRICELIDGTLVEKPMGFIESHIATIVIRYITNYLAIHDIGIALAPDGALRILPNQVRVPDVTFLSWKHFPGRKLRPIPIPALAPDLAVEVLSPSNTVREMQRKLREYFEAGTQLVLVIDPPTRSAKIYTTATEFTLIDESGTLDGGDVLPGLEIPAQALFADIAQD